MRHHLNGGVISGPGVSVRTVEFATTEIGLETNVTANLEACFGAERVADVLHRLGFAGSDGVGGLCTGNLREPQRSR